MDMNLFPQVAGLNPATSRQRTVWKAMERYVVDHPGAPLFARPAYDDPTWVPVTIDYGVLIDGRLRYERFANHD